MAWREGRQFPAPRRPGACARGGRVMARGAAASSLITAPAHYRCLPPPSRLGACAGRYQPAPAGGSDVFARRCPSQSPVVVSGPGGFSLPSARWGPVGPWAAPAAGLSGSGVGRVPQVKSFSETKAAAGHKAALSLRPLTAGALRTGRNGVCWGVLRPYGQWWAGACSCRCVLLGGETPDPARKRRLRFTRAGPHVHSEGGVSCRL